MDAKRYIIVPAIIVDNKIIPIWDKKIKAEKSKNIGEYYSYDNSYFTKYFIYQEFDHLKVFSNFKVAVKNDIFPAPYAGTNLIERMKCRHINTVPVFVTEICCVGFRDTQQVISMVQYFFIVPQFYGFLFEIIFFSGNFCRLA